MFCFVGRASGRAEVKRIVADRDLDSLRVSSKHGLPSKVGPTGNLLKTCCGLSTLVLSVVTVGWSRMRLRRGDGDVRPGGGRADSMVI